MVVERIVAVLSGFEEILATAEELAESLRDSLPKVLGCVGSSWGRRGTGSVTGESRPSGAFVGRSNTSQALKTAAKATAVDAYGGMGHELNFTVYTTTQTCIAGVTEARAGDSSTPAPGTSVSCKSWTNTC